MVTSLPLVPRYYLISTLRFMVPQQAETPIDFSDQTKEPPRPQQEKDYRWKLQ